MIVCVHFLISHIKTGRQEIQPAVHRPQCLETMQISRFIRCHPGIVEKMRITFMESAAITPNKEFCNSSAHIEKSHLQKPCFIFLNLSSLI
jgi:hypothetical protein